jgi:hypothetical protein
LAEYVKLKVPFIIDSRPQNGITKWSYFKEMKAFVCKMMRSKSWGTDAVSLVLPASGTVENTKSYFIGGVERVLKPALRVPVIHDFVLFMPSVRSGLASTKFQSKSSKSN